MIISEENEFNSDVLSDRIYLNPMGTPNVVLIPTESHGNIKRRLDKKKKKNPMGTPNVVLIPTESNGNIKRRLDTKKNPMGTPNVVLILTESHGNTKRRFDTNRIPWERQTSF